MKPKALILALALCFEAFAADGNCNCVYMTPIVLSLIPGQRFDISMAENGIPFDLNADGVMGRIGSPLDAENVGFLYLENGLDHNGRNLFGNVTGYANGFMQLASWDDKQRDSTNRIIIGPPDGVITARDGVWSLLRVWLDRNRNGLAEVNEKPTLDELNICKLELNYVPSQRQDGHGNRLSMMAKFWKCGDPKPYFMVDYIATETLEDPSMTSGT